MPLPVPTWAADGAAPNFAPDNRTGWLAGDPKSVTPIGQDFLPPPSGPGPVYILQMCGRAHLSTDYSEIKIKLKFDALSPAPNIPTF